MNMPLATTDWLADWLVGKQVGPLDLIMDYPVNWNLDVYFDSSRFKPCVCFLCSCWSCQPAATPTPSFTPLTRLWLDCEVSLFISSSSSVNATTKLKRADVMTGLGTWAEPVVSSGQLSSLKGKSIRDKFDRLIKNVLIWLSPIWAKVGSLKSFDYLLLSLGRDEQDACVAGSCSCSTCLLAEY